MAIGTRYSRWAVYAAFIAVGSLINCMTMPFVGWGYASPGSPWRVRAALGLPIAVAFSIVMLAGVPMALACLVLGTMAVREIRRSPRLRGVGLARFALVAGWSIIVIELFLYTLFVSVRWWGGN